jgi:hypothetical protein
VNIGVNENVMRELRRMGHAACARTVRPCLVIALAVKHDYRNWQMWKSAINALILYRLAANHVRDRLHVERLVRLFCVHIVLFTLHFQTYPTHVHLYAILEIVRRVRLQLPFVVVVARVKRTSHAHRYLKVC